MSTQVWHDRAVDRLREQLAALPEGAPIRLAKPTSNLFRFREPPTGQALDVSAFGDVLYVDPLTRTADVGGMTTYERLVDATLPYGLMPLVVPQLKTITLGGAVAGLGIESSSFRNGMPHESVQEMEILTGAGDVVLARPDNEHRDLFHGFPNSYGTLGYTLRLRIELEPVQPTVALRHVRFADTAACAVAIERICAERSYEGRTVDFIDGTVFSGDELYLTLGAFAGGASGLSDYTGRDIYYKSIRERATDRLSTRDYLWRWDTDWFWCSKALGAQHPVIRRLWPKRYLRSDVYRKLVALDRRHRLSDRIGRLRNDPAREAVIQDVEIPVDRLAEFMDFFHADIGISPVWLCPVRLRTDTTWPLYPMDPATLYVNVGFWATVALDPDEPDGTHNRLIERKVAELGGHKSLYSTSYFGEDEFWALYNGTRYRTLKDAYDPRGRLPDLYDKCVRNR
ncbi:MAG TPA: FAD-binding oxidoreductase [Actinophytocola sp.]|uniref:FAD-binding oxidoreductase n=1 Tax=Actinophytocola sp. TaxID=1872138 RepID=UPI002DDCA936|nr:FAD-binding oxidoreductase [Actinophytocola sp.]HEV2781723.1 FAD-binding oxidoreductase [Actinophytocola sp.]